jgi:hypothetical protein
MSNEGFELLPLPIAETIFKAIPLQGCRTCGVPFPANQIYHYEHSDGWIVNGYKEKQWLFCICPICNYQYALQKLGFGRDKSEVEAWKERVGFWKRAYVEERAKTQRFMELWHKYKKEILDMFGPLDWNEKCDIEGIVSVGQIMATPQDRRHLWSALNDASSRISDEAMHTPAYEHLQILLDGD